MKLGRIHKAREAFRRAQLHKRMNWKSVWQIVGEFVQKRLSVVVACRWLEISRPRLYALRQRWLENQRPQEVDPAWLYQRQSSCRLTPAIQDFLKKELRYLKETSPFFKGHYNFVVLAEQCRKHFGGRFHRSTIRNFAIREGFYDPKTDETGKPCIRFEMGAIGLLFQHDSSIHAWLPHTRRNDILILTIDDHSRKVVCARLVPRDTAWHHLCGVRAAVETFGCPAAYYCDNHSIFRPPQAAKGEITEPYTQFSRALSTLEIGLKFTEKAHPQAKGKVEKRFDYFQRRIPYLCERYNVTSLTQANKILDEQVQMFNELHVHAETGETPDKRWKSALEEGRSMLRPVPENIPLDIVFALHYPRKVRGDGTISFAGKTWKVPNAPLRREVTLVLKPPTSPRRPHTEIFVLYQGSTLAHFVLAKGAAPN